MEVLEVLFSMIAIGVEAIGFFVLGVAVLAKKGLKKLMEWVFK